MIAALLDIIVGMAEQLMMVVAFLLALFAWFETDNIIIGLAVFLGIPITYYFTLKTFKKDKKP
jgi:hypothetical protein